MWEGSVLHVRNERRDDADEAAGGAGRVGGERGGAELARVLDSAARALLDREEGVEHTLDLIVGGAIDAIPYVDHAGVSLVERRGVVRAAAPSSEVVRELDELQNELGEGPCLDSIWQAERTLVEDMSQAVGRWPRWAAAAHGRGIGTLMSFQLFARDGSAGALNLYAATPGVFDDGTADTGSLFASQAALVLHGAQRIAHLNTALVTRDVIGQAKGILMERFQISSDRAFTLLVRSSQDTNMRLVDVATWLVDETSPANGSRTG
ncbi:ANTAR domain-containing protein [Pseudonocardia sp. P1]